MKRGEKRRHWTPEEDAELQEIADQTLNGRRLRGWRDQPLGRLAQFARKHGRTLAAVKMRATRIEARSYLTLRQRWDEFKDETA